MVASEEAAASNASPRNNCVRTGPFYQRIRPFAIFIKVMATFPLQNICANDGRQLKHKWISAALIYDFIFFMLVGMFFVGTSMQMIEVRRKLLMKLFEAGILQFAGYNGQN
jgi:Trehalose receptor